MSGNDRVFQPLVIVAHSAHAKMANELGFKNVEVISPIAGGEQVLNHKGQLRAGWEYSRYLIALPPKSTALRDELAIRLDDSKCSFAEWPLGADADRIATVLGSARPMWADEIATIDDIPEPGEEKTYTSGFPELDQHGFRIVLPAFMPIIGPYGSGKSVFLRQLLMNLWKAHKWKFLLTSFEERVKPRYLRDLRRNLICSGPENDPATGEELWRVYSGKVQFSDTAVSRADDEIRKSAVFLRRMRNSTLDLPRLLERIEFAVRVHGVKVVAIDPVNEIDHQVPRGESKTDYMGKFIMALKAMADDYGLLVICALHPPKDGVEKRLSRTGLLTLNDGADTAHWGNKADIGFCLWRNLDGPTYLHGDKLKDHETMGKPFLAELVMNEALNKFRINRMGYHILQDQSE